MSYYRICPYCGAALDPGEKCDCGQKNRPPCRAETDGLTELGNIPIHIISYDDKKAREKFLSILDK